MNLGDNPNCLPKERADAWGRGLAVWLAVTIGSWSFVAAAAAAPMLLSEGHQNISALLYSAFSHVCHQMSERSFFLYGHQMAVCARCLGLYAGFALGALVFPLAGSIESTKPPTRKWLLLAAVPTVVDFSLGFFHIWPNTHVSRFLTGALLGGVSAFYVIPGLIDLTRINLRRFIFES
jgi:uncharacterized membrane protein